MIKAKQNRMNKLFPTVLNLACVGFATSTILDAYLWLATGYQIPSWTMAAMSFGLILLLQVLKKLMAKT